MFQKRIDELFKLVEKMNKPKDKKKPGPKVKVHG